MPVRSRRLVRSPNPIAVPAGPTTAIAPMLNRAREVGRPPLEPTSSWATAAQTQIKATAVSIDQSSVLRETEESILPVYLRGIPHLRAPGCVNQTDNAFADMMRLLHIRRAVPIKNGDSWFLIVIVTM